MASKGKQLTAEEHAENLYKAVVWSVRLIMIRAGKKNLLDGWADEQIVERVRKCAKDLEDLAPGNPNIKFRVLGQGAQSCVYRISTAGDTDIPPFALKMEGIYDEDLHHMSESPAWGFLFEASLAVVGHIWPDVAESWQFAPSYGLAAIPLLPRFQAANTNILQLNLVMKLMEGDMLEWIHGHLHSFKTPSFLSPKLYQLLKGTPFGSRVIPTALLYSLMNEALYGVRQMHALGWIHGDIKPENLFWNEDDCGNMHVFLGDMGAAAPIDRPDKRMTTMAWGGTREYMTPARIARYAKRDFTATDADDGYGLGSSMLQMLTGYQPHQDKNAWQACPAVVQALGARWYPQLSQQFELGEEAMKVAALVTAVDDIRNSCTAGQLWAVMVEAACVLMCMPELAERGKRIPVSVVQDILQDRGQAIMQQFDESCDADSLLIRGNLLSPPETMLKLLRRAAGKAEVMDGLRELHADVVKYEAPAPTDKPHVKFVDDGPVVVATKAQKSNGSALSKAITHKLATTDADDDDEGRTNSWRISTRPASENPDYLQDDLGEVDDAAEPKRVCSMAPTRKSPGRDMMVFGSVLDLKASVSNSSSCSRTSPLPSPVIFEPSSDRKSSSNEAAAVAKKSVRMLTLSRRQATVCSSMLTQRKCRRTEADGEPIVSARKTAHGCHTSDAVVISMVGVAACIAKTQQQVGDRNAAAPVRNPLRLLVPALKSRLPWCLAAVAMACPVAMLVLSTNTKRPMYE